jgi:hypothetical protein
MTTHELTGASGRLFLFWQRAAEALERKREERKKDLVPPPEEAAPTVKSKKRARAGEEDGMGAPKTKSLRELSTSFAGKGAGREGGAKASLEDFIEQPKKKKKKQVVEDSS